MSGRRFSVPESAVLLADAFQGRRARIEDSHQRPQDWSVPLAGRRPVLDEDGNITGVEPPQTVQEVAGDEIRELVAHGDVAALEDLFAVLKARARLNASVLALEEAASEERLLDGARTDLAWAALAEAHHVGMLASPWPWRFNDGTPNLEGLRVAVQALDARLQAARMDGSAGFLATSLPAGKTVWSLFSGPGRRAKAPSSEQSLERTGTGHGEHGRKWRRTVETFMARGDSMSACVEAWLRGNVDPVEDVPADSSDPPETANPEN